MSASASPADLRARDTAARLRALTDLDSTLLVEAGAGSGKTSVLAGRIVMLLASGRPPTEIAAITFTEAAASELRQRVEEFVTDVLRGETTAAAATCMAGRTDGRATSERCRRLRRNLMPSPAPRSTASAVCC